MPEPTTGPDELDQARIEEIRTKVARWTPRGASDLMFDLATISALLTAYDQQARDLDAFGHAISDQSRRAQEAENRAVAAEAELARLNDFCWHIDTPCDCPNPPDPEQAYHAMRAARDFERNRAVTAAAELAELRAAHTNVSNVLSSAFAEIEPLRARAAAAEAAVQRVREQGEERVKELLAMCAGARGNGELRTVSEALEFTACDVRSLVDALPEQPVYDWTGVVEDNDQPYEPLATIAALVAAAPDDLPVTLQAQVLWFEFRVNRAGAAYLELTLADLGSDLENDPEIITVRLPGTTMLPPHPGTVLLVEGTTRRRVEVIAADVREPVESLEEGEPVYDLTGQPLPSGMEWTAEDQDAWHLRMRRYGLDPDTLPMPAVAPPFAPVAASQFVAGYQACRQQTGDGAQ